MTYLLPYKLEAVQEMDVKGHAVTSGYEMSWKSGDNENDIWLMCRQVGWKVTEYWDDIIESALSARFDTVKIIPNKLILWNNTAPQLPREDRHKVIEIDAPLRRVISTTFEVINPHDKARRLHNAIMQYESGGKEGEKQQI